MKKRVVILALAAIMICGAIFTGCSTQTEKEESERGVEEIRRKIWQIYRITNR